MKIKQAEFKGAFVSVKQLSPGNLPEIAIVGRSNVGKSSLINKIANRKNLAKSSSTPGKTRTINYYLINGKFYLVDLPGYGYARAPKAERVRWGKMIEDYLRERQQLCGVIHLVDIRHVPGDNDVLMQTWLRYYNIPYLVVATKADKISKGARQKHIAAVMKAFNMQTGEGLICFSAHTGEGVSEVLTAIQEILNIGIPEQGLPVSHRSGDKI